MLNKTPSRDAINPDQGPARARPDLQAMLDALTLHGEDTILAVDGTGRVHYCNRELSMLAGDDDDEGCTIFDFLAPSGHARCRDVLHTVCQLGQADQFESRWIDGSVRAIRVIPLPRQKTALALAICGDVTKVRRVEEALRESELRFRQLAENVREVFWLMDADKSRVLYVTNAYQRVWGRAATELYDGLFGWFDAVYPEDRPRVERAFAAGLASGGFQAEYRITRPDGSLRWIRDRAFASFGADGQISRIAGIAEDITDQRNVEDSLRMERKLLKRLLDLQERERHLLACEIHDGFIQDLVGAKMLLESLRPGLPPENPCSIERLDKIEAALRKAIGEGRRMISNLRPMVIDDKGILVAIEYLINEKQADSGPQMTFAHDVRFTRLPPLLEGALFRIVQESLTNARRHSKAAHVHVDLAQVDERVILTIVDDGVGFDRAAVPEGRFGLRGLVERARLFGGRADVRSEPGSGTRIWVELPISKSALSL
ncbi:MAG TPA: PAS domain-containing protein [Pirellulales bacterium]|jgi:PAS domain S-box-containing protein